MYLWFNHTLRVHKDTVLTDKIPQYILNVIKCMLKIISPFNHGSLSTERHIQTYRNMNIKHLRVKGARWPLFTAIVAHVMNSSASISLDGFSPY